MHIVKPKFFDVREYFIKLFYNSTLKIKTQLFWFWLLEYMSEIAVNDNN